ncbi:MAG: ribosome maturation factor RimP [Clostridia bacterium]|nr:ribosome maturation factor RimP [Clostridia bacterium]MBQ6894465.1 ribosome maturation factor RimP [Clostridia bacterium]
MYSKTEKTVLDMATPVAKEQGCFVYDVEYVKEGNSWFLRVYVDREGGITIDECEAISRELSSILDKNDPISNNYFLEVSSPGIERKLRQEEHFRMYKGEMVDIGLYKAYNGSKNLCGELLGLDGDEVSIDLEGEKISIKLNETTYVKLHFEF